MKPEKKKHRALRILCGTLVCLGLLFALGIGGIALFALRNVDPALDEALFAAAGQSTVTRLYYNGGPDSGIAELPELPGYYPVEIPGQTLRHAGMQQHVPLAEMPHTLQYAFVAVEDKRFFEHDGVDFLRTGKAAVNYVLHFDGRFGGSTITQQLIKNIGGEDEATVFRKCKEMLRALSLEKRHSKEEILEAYLNIVPLGHGCIGVGSGAMYYFSTAPESLSVAQCASLAAITNAPGRYDPVKYPEAHLARRNLVLDRMAEQGYLTEKQAAEAKAEGLSLCLSEQKEDCILNWYVETVLTDLQKDLTEQYGYTRQAADALIWNGGLSVYTYMEPTLQDTLQGYFEDLSHFPWQTEEGLQYAMAVTDVRTGHLSAIVGGVGKKTGNRLLNRASDTTRAPGSALKPLALYAPALEAGLLTPATVYDDVPVSFGNAGDPVPFPRNSPNIYSGLCNVRTALVHSKNTVAVRIYRQLGKEKIYSTLVHQLGFSTILRKGKRQDGGMATDLAVSPLALGQLTVGVSVREMTAAFGALANEGTYAPADAYALVLDRNGKPLLQKESVPTRVFRREVARLTTWMMEGVVEEGTARDITLCEAVDTAGKTGTSGNSHDKWFAGYTPYLCATLWCGYDNAEKGVVSLSLSQTQIWDAVMRRLHRSVFSAQEPLRHFSKAGLIRCRVCRDSGDLVGEHCALDPRGERAETLYFLPGTQPTAVCRRHVPVLYDTLTGGVATEACLHQAEVSHLAYTALLDIPWRSFPTEVYVRDAEYVYRPLAGAQPGKFWDVPYFAATLPQGVYVGLTDHENGRQYNAACYEHYYTPSTTAPDTTAPEPALPPDSSADTTPPFPPSAPDTAPPPSAGEETTEKNGFFRLFRSRSG